MLNVAEQFAINFLKINQVMRKLLRFEIKDYFIPKRGDEEVTSYMHPHNHKKINTSHLHVE